MRFLPPTGTARCSFVRMRGAQDSPIGERRARRPTLASFVMAGLQASRRTAGTAWCFCRLPRTQRIWHGRVGLSGRAVTGLSGPLEQVQPARSALQIDAADLALDGAEGLYALDLPELIVPEALSDGAVVCRPPHPEERDMLCAWRMAYDIEILGATDSEEHRRRAAHFLDAQIAEGNAWVAMSGPVLVSLSAFNASLPDIVQLGGIYTPPEFRGRGFAKAAVAASLLVARDRGASRAVLFTNNPSAVRTYAAIGFRRIGDYSLLLLR